MASADLDLRHTLGQLATECEAVGMKFLLKSEVLRQKMVRKCLIWFGRELLSSFINRPCVRLRVRWSRRSKVGTGSALKS